ncbi:tetratricopeptide repeat protein [Umezawaea endophytica]|uniref:Tetratricopeptide repeat protein n=1 Tax=Umezawaea endophytica TaxID=1654476 RepID=A0A9X3A3T3_9PSEU|nr:tetratricopeptide repeat protein [Umezawaea endophytica]
MAPKPSTVQEGTVLPDEPADRPLPAISPREREIVALLVGEQLEAKEVAERLNITEATVQEHLNRVRVKYDLIGRSVRTRNDLHARATEDGLLTFLTASSGNMRGLQFGVLGPLQVLADGRPLVLGRKGMRGLLAMLVLDANRVVPIDEIVDRIWADDPPATARTIVHGYVSKLRKLLEEADPTGSAAILTSPPGYQLSVDPVRLDLHQARQLISSARGKPALTRARLLREALGLWRGQVLADVPGNPITTDLHELRLSAVEERIDAELELGRHLELIGELRQLLTEYPFRERLVEHMTLALYRSGQRADALETYHRSRRRFIDELGIEPGPNLRELHERILRDDLSLSTLNASEKVLLQHHSTAVPTQLPAAANEFIGRAAELAWLDRICAQWEPAATVILIDGAPGIGKTELAVTWGHRRAELFPGGLLFADMHGFGPNHNSVEPSEALTRFLLALGVPADAVPRDLNDQVGLYRSLLAKRQVLVVLDDAWDPEHVRLLLPPSAGSVVLVTTRRRLESLVISDGARMLTVGTLSDEESARLVDELAGEPLSRTDPAATKMLVELCGRLPLALKIATITLLPSPRWTMRMVIAAMSREPIRMRVVGLYDTGDVVKSALAVSYRSLSAELALTFRATSLVPGRWVSPHAIAAICDIDLGTAAGRLANLVDAHLIVEQWRNAFMLHDLVRVYARELVSEHERNESLSRLLDHYLIACDHARRLIRPASDGLSFNASLTAAGPASASQALSWFDKEWANLTGLVHAGSEAGLHEQTWQLVRLVHTYCLIRLIDHEWHTVAETGLTSARAIGDRRGELLVLHATQDIDNRAGTVLGALDRAEYTHRIAVELKEPRYLVMTLDKLALALRQEGRTAEALAHQREAFDIVHREGDTINEATVLNNLAQTEQNLGNFDFATQHQSQAAELYKYNDDKRAYANAMNNLAELYAEQGLFSQAEIHSRHGVELAQRGSMQFEEAFGRQVLGKVLAKQGKHTEAQTELMESLMLFERLGSPRAMLVRTALEHLSIVH